jgi:prolyl 4-hydroxylase
MRTSSSLKIEHKELPEDVREVLAVRVGALTGLPVENQERWEIIRYLEGEHFGAHHDVPIPGGQRLFSVVVALRAPEAGGQLWFQAHSWTLAAGSLIVWRNMRVNGTRDPSARHASLPVERGTKWSLVTWVRERRA